MPSKELDDSGAGTQGTRTTSSSAAPSDLNAPWKESSPAADSGVRVGTV